MDKMSSKGSASFRVGDLVQFKRREGSYQFAMHHMPLQQIREINANQMILIVPFNGDPEDFRWVQRSDIEHALCKWGLIDWDLSPEEFALQVQDPPEIKIMHRWEAYEDNKKRRKAGIKKLWNYAGPADPEEVR